VPRHWVTVRNLSLKTNSNNRENRSGTKLAEATGAVFLTCGSGIELDKIYEWTGVATIAGMIMDSSYAGQILRVDLNQKKCVSDPVNSSWLRQFVGGKGLAARYLFHLLRPGVDPLSPENVLILMTGPLTGTIASTMSRVAVVSKSPLTDTFLDSYAGGYFPAELKFAGFDGIIVTGKAREDIYLWVRDGKAELKDAIHLRGLDTHAATAQVLKETDKDAHVGVIGPGGENLVKYAGITFDLYHFAGRGGAGAVMGSKNLKAICVRGTKGTKAVSINGDKGFQSLVREVIDKDIHKNPNVQWAVTTGTPGTFDYSNQAGILPTRNFQTGVFEKAHEIDSKAFKDKILVKHHSTCFSCAIGCRNESEVREGKYKGVKGEGPEYETLTNAGSNCGIGDLGTISAFSIKCGKLGIDTMSAGSTVAFAMELFERGILRKDQTNGLDLRFGNEEAYLQMPDLIAYRKGIGDMLAEGIQTACQKIGHDCDKYALHVKGLEYPGYDPRGSVAMALAYATSDRGACHKRAWPVAAEAFGNMDPFTPKDKAKLVVDGQLLTAMQYCLVACEFMGVQLPTIARLLEATTGFKGSTEDLLTIARRAWNLTRMFNVREGFTRKDDSLPRRISEETLPDGKPKGHRLSTEDFQFMLDEYYKLWGWNSNGIPTPETLQELGLSELH
jgi:aldehyde:ferredoxin oxidoreductase